MSGRCQTVDADRLLDYPLSIYRRSEAFYTKGDVVSQMELAKRPAPPRSSTKRSRPAVSHAKKSAKKGSKKGVKEGVKEGVKDVKEEEVKDVKEEGVKGVKEEGVKGMKEEEVKDVKEEAKELTKEEAKEEMKEEVKEESKEEGEVKEESKEELNEESKEEKTEEDVNEMKEDNNKPDETKETKETLEPMDVEQEDITMEQAQSLQGDARPEVIILACSSTRLHFWPFPELHTVHAGKRSASIDVTQFAPEVSIEDAAFMDGFDKEGAVVGVACKRGAVLVVDVYQKKLLYNVRVAGWTDA